MCSFSGGLIAAIAGAFVISRRALRPLSDLARTTQEIIESGDLSRESPYEARTMAWTTCRLFNCMLTRNEIAGTRHEGIVETWRTTSHASYAVANGRELALNEPEDASKTNEALPTSSKNRSSTQLLTS